MPKVFLCRKCCVVNLTFWVMWRTLAKSKYLAASCGLSGYVLTRNGSLPSCQLSSSAISASVASMRKEYSKQGLFEKDLPVNPIQLFENWLSEARDAQVLEPNAMCLSTCLNDKPSGRMVLLKDFDEEGFVWFTNYTSRKGNELDANPNASLTFWWGDIERSVRVEGTVEKISPTESTQYHSVRPVDSQIGAWSSNQSKPIESRSHLANQEEAMRQKLCQEFLQQGKPIPLPPHWGGYRLRPTRIEFWKGREGRMHDRIVYERSNVTESVADKGCQWRMLRLQP